MRAREEFQSLPGASAELEPFKRLLNDSLAQLDEGLIVSTGYVLHTLHAAVWSLLTTSNFRDCVLRAVNLGGDTDTTGCVAGGLAGLAYGATSIPDEWIAALARKGDMERLFDDFVETLQPS